MNRFSDKQPPPPAAAEKPPLAPLQARSLCRHALWVWTAVGMGIVGGSLLEWRRPLADPPAGSRALRIDLNTADADSLALLPRIGPILARAIVDDRRRRGLFPSPEALLRVPRVGPVTLAGVLPHVQVGAEEEEGQAPGSAAR